MVLYKLKVISYLSLLEKIVTAFELFGLNQHPLRTIKDSIS